MRIALIGATGRIGRVVLHQSLLRGHPVRALLRPGRDAATLPPAATAVPLDLFDAEALACALAGIDAVVSAYGAPPDAPPKRLADLAAVLVRAMAHAGVARLVTVGGAGVLETAPGVRLGDAPGFPEALQDKVRAHAEAIDILHGADPTLAWTCVAPAEHIAAVPPTGRWRQEVGRLVRRADGSSRIGYADFATALLDELVQCRHPRQVLGVGEADQDAADADAPRRARLLENTVPSAARPSPHARNSARQAP